MFAAVRGTPPGSGFLNTTGGLRMTTSVRVMCVLAAALCGFCFLFGEKRSAEAQQPPPCPQHDCKDVYGWWTLNQPGGTQCFAAKETGTQTNTTHAYIHIYATASSGQLPTINCGTYDRHIFSNNTATCGQVGGQWQSPQEVVPKGTGKLDGNRPRQACTPKVGLPPQCEESPPPE
jgi:hypothetical protein